MHPRRILDQGVSRTRYIGRQELDSGLSSRYSFFYHLTGTLQPLAIASGLSVGKEGPSVHMACCIGNVVGRMFDRFNRSQGSHPPPLATQHMHQLSIVEWTARMREIVTASSAAGVAVAFGSPIGGVLFALEVRFGT